MTRYAQLTLLAPELPAKITAIARVERHADPAWLASARSTLRHLCARQFYLNSDSLWLALEQAGVPMPHEPRALGAVMRWGVREGLIKATGEYEPSWREACHQRPIMRWRVVK